MKKVCIALCACIGLLAASFFIYKFFFAKKELYIYCTQEEAEIYKEFVEKYSSANDVDINVVVYEADSYKDKLKDEKNIDIIALPKSVTYRDFSSEVSLRDLSSIYDMDEYIPDLGKNTKIIPVAGEIGLLIVKSDLLRSNGLNTPKSFRELEDTVLALKLAEIQPFLFESDRVGLMDLDILIDSLWINSPAYDEKVIDEEVIINQGIGSIESLANSLSANFASVDKAEAVQSDEVFLLSSAAMMPVKSSYVTSLDSLRGDIEVIRFPAADIYDYTAWYSDMRLSIHAKSSNEREAKKFVKYVLSQDVQQHIYDAYGLLPVSRKCTINAYLGDIYSEISTDNKVKIAVSELLPESYKIVQDVDINNMFTKVNTSVEDVDSTEVQN